MRLSIAHWVFLLSIFRGCSLAGAPPDDSEMEINNIIANSRQCFFIVEEEVALAKQTDPKDEENEKEEEDEESYQKSNHLIVNSEWGYNGDRTCYDRSFTNNPCVDIFFNCPDDNCSSRNETIQDLFCGLTASNRNDTNLNYTNLNYTNLNYTNFNYTNLNDTNLNDITNETTTMVPDNSTTSTIAPTKSASVTFKAKQMPPDINQTVVQKEANKGNVRILGITPECWVFYAHANEMVNLPSNWETHPPPDKSPKRCLSSRVFDIFINIRDQKVVYVNRVIINTHGERIRVVFTPPLQKEFREDDNKLTSVQYAAEIGEHRSYWSSPLDFHIVKEIIQLRGRTFAVTRYFEEIRIYEVLVYLDNLDADTDPVILLEERGFLTMPDTLFPNSYDLRVGVNAFQENGRWEIGIFARSVKDKTKRRSVLFKGTDSTFSIRDGHIMKIERKNYKGNEHFYEQIGEPFLTENGANYLYSKQVHCLRSFGHFPTFVPMRWNNFNNTQDFIDRAPARIPLRRKIATIRKPFGKTRPYVMEKAVTIFGVSSLLVYLMSMTVNTILTRLDSMRLDRSKALDLMEAQRGWDSGGTGGGSHSKGSKGSAGYPRSGEKSYPKSPYPKWKFTSKGKVYSSESGTLKLSGERRPSRERAPSREKRLSEEKVPKKVVSNVEAPQKTITSQEVPSLVVVSNERVPSRVHTKEKVGGSDRPFITSVEYPQKALSNEQVPKRKLSKEKRSDETLSRERRAGKGNIKTVSRKRKNVNRIQKVPEL